MLNSNRIVKREGNSAKIRGTLPADLEAAFGGKVISEAYPQGSQTKYVVRIDELTAERLIATGFWLFAIGQSPSAIRNIIRSEFSGRIFFVDAQTYLIIFDSDK